MTAPICRRWIYLYYQPYLPLHPDSAAAAAFTTQDGFSGCQSRPLQCTERPLLLHSLHHSRVYPASSWSILSITWSLGQPQSTSTDERDVARVPEKLAAHRLTYSTAQNHSWVTCTYIEALNHLVEEDSFQ